MINAAWLSLLPGPARGGPGAAALMMMDRVAGRLWSRRGWLRRPVGHHVRRLSLTRGSVANLGVITPHRHHWSLPTAGGTGVVCPYPRLAGVGCPGLHNPAGTAARNQPKSPSGRVEVSLPAVLGHDGLLSGAQPASVAHRGVPLDVPDRPHARDHGRDRVPAEHVAQRYLGDLIRFDAKVGDQCIDVLLDLRLPVPPEEAVAEVAVGKGGVGGDPAGEAALVQGDPDDDADAMLGAGGKQVLLRRLVERVVDDLDGVDVAAAHQVQGVVRLIVVDRHPEEPDLPLALEVLDGLQPVAAAHPLVAPDVELEQVERLQAGRAQALLQAGPDVVAGEGL